MICCRKADLRPARRQAAPEGKHMKKRAGVTVTAEEQEDSFHTW